MQIRRRSGLLAEANFSNTAGTGPKRESNQKVGILKVEKCIVNYFRTI